MTRRWCLVALIALLIVGVSLPAAAANSSSSTVAEAQRIMARLGIPSGPVDGLPGAQTSRGLCVFRSMAGLPVSRAGLDAATLATLRDYGKRYRSLAAVPAPTRHGQRTYLVANETCQTMVYVEHSSTKDKSYYRRVMPISTGISGYDTPNGDYWLAGTQKGWWCSTLYPETCRDNKDSDGRFGALRNHPGKPAGWGNMYNFRVFKSGGWGVHGSKSVPTHPASHGCIRVGISDSDWMYEHVGNHGPTYLSVIGRY